MQDMIVFKPMQLTQSAQLEKKDVLFHGNPIKIFLQYCSISRHFFMYFFILEVKLPPKVKISWEPGSWIPLFPGMTKCIK